VRSAAAAAAANNNNNNNNNNSNNNREVRQIATGTSNKLLYSVPASSQSVSQSLTSFQPSRADQMSVSHRQSQHPA
jgi:hypothetical protein